MPQVALKRNWDTATNTLCVATWLPNLATLVASCLYLYTGISVGSFPIHCTQDDTLLYYMHGGVRLGVEELHIRGMPCIRQSWRSYANSFGRNIEIPRHTLSVLDNNASHGSVERCGRMRPPYGHCKAA